MDADSRAATNSHGRAWSRLPDGPRELVERAERCDRRGHAFRREDDVHPHRPRSGRIRSPRLHLPGVSRRTSDAVQDERAARRRGSVLLLDQPVRLRDVRGIGRLSPGGRGGQRRAEGIVVPEVARAHAPPSGGVRGARGVVFDAEEELPAPCRAAGFRRADHDAIARRHGAAATLLSGRSADTSILPGGPRCHRRSLRDCAEGIFQ